MPVNDELGKRMKEFYEQVPKTRLVRRTPVAIRIDGKAFHTFTRGFEKPFDEVLGRAMRETMKYLCENIQGCVLGYTQSDEITLILIDYKKLTSSAWFDYEVQKMCSIAASMATMAFNRAFDREVTKFYYRHNIIEPSGNEYWDSQDSHIRFATYDNARDKGAMFDARVFNIPKEELGALLNSGRTQQQIAEYYGCSVDTVQRRMKDYGLSRTARNTAENTAPRGTADFTAKGRTQLNVNDNDNGKEKENGSGKYATPPQLGF